MNAMPARDMEMLNRRRKAAMVVQILLADGQRLALSRLSEDSQVNLTRELASLRMVDKETLNSVAEEFSRELEAIGLTTPGGVEGALAALGGQLSPEAQNRLRREAAAARARDPWAIVTDLPVEELLPIMDRETVEVAAVVLSKLPVPRAAELLSKLPGERARRITYAVSQTADVSPEAVTRIGRALAAEYGQKPDQAFIAPPVQRIGAILNSSQAATREAMLESLTETDAKLAEQIRKAIFTFPDIPERVNRTDVPKVLRGIDNSDLVVALAASLGLGGREAEAAEFLLGNMSQRMAESLRDEVRDRGKIRKSDGEKGMGAVVSAIRDLLDSGEITLAQTEEEDDG